MATLRPNEVQFLAFEGGGGKGVTYMGAIKAMEELKILGLPGRDKIKGIAGASAGAITAFFLSMGFRSGSLETLIMNEKKPGTAVSIFDSFTDDFAADHAGEVRAIVTREFQGRKINVPAWQKNPLLDVKLNWLLSRVVVPALHKKLEAKAHEDPLIGKMVYNSTLEAHRRHLRNPTGKVDVNDLAAFKMILNNLLTDGGLLVGVNVRKYFSSKISQYFLHKSICDPLTRKRYRNHRKGNTILGLEGCTLPNKDFLHLITFRQFYYLTGIDFRVTGTNITRNAPMYFSVVDTPDFPVVEAVGISMNIPILYKPILVNCEVDLNRIGSSYNEKYKGLYVDGGMVNNLPLHAFDYHAELPEESFAGKAGGGSGKRSLHRRIQVPLKSPADVPFILRDSPKHLSPGVLGLRLSENQQEETLFQKVVKYSPIPILGYMGDLMNTFLAQAEDGQIRFLTEKEQIINLSTFDLTTTEFAPPEEKSEKPMREAYRAVKAYFMEPEARLVPGGL